MINVGSLKLRQGKGMLNEVVVTAQKSQIQLGIDKKTFNVEQSLFSQGGSATDLLSNVPSVQVDVDGNLSLRGSTSVRVLIKRQALSAYRRQYFGHFTIYPCQRHRIYRGNYQPVGKI